MCEKINTPRISSKDVNIDLEHNELFTNYLWYIEQ